jgi:hypothetical protein
MNNEQLVNNKNMKTIKFILLTILLSYGVNTYAQQVSIPVKVKSDGKVVVNNLDAGIIIDGYHGRELLISVDNYQKPPERAKGLKPVYYHGVDNTGIGLSIEEINKIIEISGVSPRTRHAKYTIKIPNDLNLKVASPGFQSRDIQVRNFMREVEVESKSGDINLEDVSGPVIINNLSGNVLVKFSKVTQDYPISLRAVSGDIDVTLPDDTPANLKMKSITGEIYTNFEPEYENTPEKGRLPRIGGHVILAKINGGGVEINLETMSGNIFLRKAE